MIAYWPLDDYLRPLQSSTGAPVSNRYEFQPDAGNPIVRPRTTARMEQWSLEFSFPDATTMGVFEDWVRDDLLQGTLPYVWRHPRTQIVARWQMTDTPYTETNVGGTTVRVTFAALMLPGKVPLAPYIAPNSARVPDWVADYTADKYWIAGVPVAATALAAITGTYVVLEQRGVAGQRFITKTYDEDVPQTAPTGVAWFSGFLL